MHFPLQARTQHVFTVLMNLRRANLILHFPLQARTQHVCGGNPSACISQSADLLMHFPLQARTQHVCGGNPSACISQKNADLKMR